jgi:multisubunit Na+/H+ antiporter MnhB subunit
MHSPVSGIERRPAITERQTAALFDLVVSAALLLLVLVALARFFQVFAQPDLGLRRFAFLPIGLAVGALYAAFRARRALKTFRRGSP